MKISKVIALTKIFLKNSFQTSLEKQGLSSNSNHHKNKGMKFLYGLLFLYIAGILGYFSYTMISGLVEIHQETIFLGIFFLGLACFILFQSTFTTMNVFYFSKDIEYVLPWPLDAKEIIMAKLNVILVTEYILEFAIGLIPFILYGILTGAGIGYYLIAMILLLVFPILPLLICGFLVMLVMSFAKFTRKRDTFQLIATFAVVALVLGGQMLIQKYTNQSTTQQMTQQQMIESMTKANGAIESIQNYFITVKPSISALSNTNGWLAILDLLKVILITAIAYIMFILVGQKLYLKGAVGNLVGGKIKRKQINIQKAYKPHTVGVSYVKKEFKMLIRNPIFFMQCIMPAVLIPIIFLGMGFFGVKQNEGTEELVNMIPINGAITIYAVLGIMQFFTMMSYISATAISRDGLNANFVKYIPISLYKQFIYKATPNAMMNMISMLIVMGVFYYLFPSTSLLLLVVIFILGMLLNVISSYLMLIVDLKRPKLEWSTEYAVVKQNINLVFPMAWGIFQIFLLLLLGIVAGNINPIIISVILFFLLGGVTYGIDRYVKKHQEELFKKII